jgi:hypothetical protein
VDPDPGSDPEHWLKGLSGRLNACYAAESPQAFFKGSLRIRIHAATKITTLFYTQVHGRLDLFLSSQHDQQDATGFPNL